MAEKNKYLKAMEYGFENTGFSKEDMNRVSGLTPGDWGYLADGSLFRPRPGGGFELSYSAVMAYLDYIDLKEARESAKDAKKMATVAMLISAVLAVGSIALQAYAQFSGPPQVALTKDQLDGLIPPRPPFQVILGQEQLDQLGTVIGLAGLAGPAQERPGR